MLDEERLKANQLRMDQKAKEAEEKAEREKLKTQEKEEQLQREAAQREIDRQFKAEQAAAKLEGKDVEDLGPTDVETKEEFTDAQSEAETAIKVGQTADAVVVGEIVNGQVVAGTSALEVDETEEIRAQNQLLPNETAEGVAARVLGAPITEVAGGETTMTVGTETIEEKVAHDEALGGIRG